MCPTSLNNGQFSVCVVLCMGKKEVRQKDKVNESGEQEEFCKLCILYEWEFCLGHIFIVLQNTCSISNTLSTILTVDIYC